MPEVEPITKISQTLQRADGSEARIVAQACFGAGLQQSIDVYVHRRESPDHEWVLCSDSPHKDWRDMSVDEYIKHGRSEVLQTVSPGEIMKVASAIGKPKSQFDQKNAAQKLAEKTAVIDRKLELQPANNSMY